MITAINMGLLGVVLAAAALVIVRRRRSGAGEEIASEAPAEETPAPAAEPAAVADEEASIADLRHAWSEAVATLMPVQEDHEETDSLAGIDVLDTGHDTDDGAEHETEDPYAEDEQGQETGEIRGPELEATTDPDDGLGDIITEPGWYLPGEVNMSWEAPSAETGLLAPEMDLEISDGLLDDGLAPVIEAPPAPLPAESADDFSATPGWAPPVENGEEPDVPGWLGLADEEGAVATVHDEVAFEITPSPSEDLFSLPSPSAGAMEGEPDIDAFDLSLERWQGPVAASPSFAFESEEVEPSASRGEDDVPSEPPLTVEPREDAGAPGGDRPDTAPSNGDHRQSKAGGFWAPDDLIERIQAWNETYGSPPGARDWSPSMARKQGRDDIAERFELDGCWPHVNTVQRVFGSWNEGVRAAGFTPRRAGARGPGNPRAVPLLADD